ncbi:hypothetical protein DCH27_25315 [Salmonella enterica]|nr:hypothetical protein [Salmonella enterica]
MGLFGGVTQSEHDNLKKDFQRMTFINDLNDFKAASAMMFSDMKLQVGKSCGVIDSVGALVEAGLIETAGSLYRLVEPQLVQTINKASHIHREIVKMAQGLGTAQNAYIAHLNNDDNPLYQQISDTNDLNCQCIKMLKSFDQMFGIERG